MSVEDYKEFCTALHCAICNREVVLVTDHCHSTGVVRGRLCVRCNTGLGKFLDDPEMLSKAIEYLGGYANGEQAASKPATG